MPTSRCSTAARGCSRRARGSSSMEFRRYVERLEMPRRYPGVQGIGFSRFVPPADRAHILQVIRPQHPDLLLLAGDPDRRAARGHLSGAGERPEHAGDRLQHVFGADAERRDGPRPGFGDAGGERAGTAGPGRLHRDGPEQKGFLIYEPVYRTRECAAEYRRSVGRSSSASSTARSAPAICSGPDCRAARGRGDGRPAGLRCDRRRSSVALRVTGEPAIGPARGHNAPSRSPDANGCSSSTARSPHRRRSAVEWPTCCLGAWSCPCCSSARPWPRRAPGRPPNGHRRSSGARKKRCAPPTVQRTSSSRWCRTSCRTPLNAILGWGSMLPKRAGAEAERAACARSDPAQRPRAGPAGRRPARHLARGRRLAFVWS